jgi:F-box-like
MYCYGPHVTSGDQLFFHREYRVNLGSMVDTASAEARGHLLPTVDHERNVLEPIQASKWRQNAAVSPISYLPHETFARILSFLSHSADYQALICATHVCRHWRETALNYPHVWSHINFAKLTPIGIAEIVARAKMAPLHLEALFTYRSTLPELDEFEKQLEAHISHTRYLSLSGYFRTVLEHFVSPAPALEFLSLSQSFDQPQFVISDTLFNCTTPKLKSLELDGCDISWKSPFLKGLQTLEIRGPSAEARPTLKTWLKSLNEMPQLETLILHTASPLGSTSNPPVSAPRCTVTLPSLTRFGITASAEECALALSHLVLPVLTSLQVDARFHKWGGNVVGQVISQVVRNAHGPQDKAPLQSMTIRGWVNHVEILAWTTRGANVGDFGSILTHPPVRMAFRASPKPDVFWGDEMDNAIVDSLLTHLPVKAVSTFSTQSETWLRKEFWLRHASSLAGLNRVCLAPSTFRAFREMLAEASPDGPRFPGLTKLILSNVPLTALRTYRLCDVLKKRMEEGAQLETLDLRTCTAAKRAIEMLAETVSDVQGPPETLETGDPPFFNWKGGADFFDEEEKRTDDEEYDNGSALWYVLGNR